ncbi:hypothetical protein V2J09_005393 [Rumex salicifolius]
MFEDSSLATPSSSKEAGPKVGEGCLSSMTRELPFSSGNPTIEETRGIMHLFRDDVVSSVSKLPVERKPLICVLGVPNHMTYADFCQFCGSFIQHMQEMRVVRINDMDDRYSVLVRFDGQDSTDDFYKRFNGKKFSSLEVETCHVFFIVDVLYTGSIEHAHASVLNSSEQPTCPTKTVEGFLQQSAIILFIVLASHAGQIHLALYADFASNNLKNQYVSFVKHLRIYGCVYKEGHAITHWKETQHCYSLEVETQRVWDYVGDNYVHRLIQSKTDGKLVELNARCTHVESGCDTCDCSEEDPAFKEAISNSKVEVIVSEYNELLSTQLEKQKLYYESLLQEVNDETQREISEAVGKAVSLKCDKLQAKLNKCVEEKKFHDDINENLLKNQEIFKVKIKEAEERMKKSVQLKDDKIRDLEAELASLLMALESGETVEQVSISEETKEEEDSSSTPGESSSETSSQRDKMCKNGNK